jgi:hypothetical protein
MTYTLTTGERRVRQNTLDTVLHNVQYQCRHPLARSSLTDYVPHTVLSQPASRLKCQQDRKRTGMQKVQTTYIL